MTLDPSTDLANLEFSLAQMRALSTATLERVLDHLARINDHPAVGDPEEAKSGAGPDESTAPEQPTELAPILDAFFGEWIARGLVPNGPGYFGYVPGGGVFPAALAELLSNTTNRYTGTRFGAPALVALEADALAWFQDWMQFPTAARGLFTTGGSMANFNAILCARERHLGPDIRSGVLYISSQANHSIGKSARLAGIMADRVRTLPVDRQFRMRVDALVDAIARDREAGLVPFIVVSSAGTTSTGAVDPLEAIADVCAREQLWHHADGAYGAFFHACPELRPLLAGLHRADSVTLDPHKGLFLPYGTGALLVRDGEALRAVHASTADYLPDRPRDTYDPSEYGPDLSRGFPGFRVWLTVKLFGAAKIRAAIAEKRMLACMAAERIAAIDGIEMVAPPQLSLFAFHLRWPGSTRETENAATRELLERVVARRRVFLTGCTTEGRYLARVCVLSFRTRSAHMEQCIEDVAEEARYVLASRS